MKTVYAIIIIDRNDIIISMKYKAKTPSEPYSGFSILILCTAELTAAGQLPVIYLRLTI